MFSPQFAAQRETAVRWMTAYLRGIRDYNDAFVKHLHQRQTTEMLASALGIQPGLFNDVSLGYADPNGAVYVDGIQAQMDWYVEAGYLSAPLDLTRIVDASFAEAAVQRIGTYR